MNAHDCVHREKRVQNQQYVTDAKRASAREGDEEAPHQQSSRVVSGCRRAHFTCNYTQAREPKKVRGLLSNIYDIQWVMMEYDDDARVLGAYNDV